MRIDDSGLSKIDVTRNSNSSSVKSSKDKSSSQSVQQPPDDGFSQGTTRSQRIEQLKAMFQAGQPIDVQKLADKLVESGIFSNTKA